jgi:hypothetical protein
MILLISKLKRLSRKKTIGKIKMSPLPDLQVAELQKSTTAAASIESCR